MWVSHVTHMNESCHRRDHAMSHTWKSHGTHMKESCHTRVKESCHTRVKESCHTYRWVMAHVWMSHVTHIWQSHVIRVDDSWHNYERVMSHTYEKIMSHVFNESWQTYGWVMSHTYGKVMSNVWMRHGTHVWMSRVINIWTSHVKHVYESWRTCEWVMAHVRMSHGACNGARMNESCHTHINKSYHTQEWFISHKCLKIRITRSRRKVREQVTSHLWIKWRHVRVKKIHTRVKKVFFVKQNFLKKISFLTRVWRIFESQGRKRERRSRVTHMNESHHTRQKKNHQIKMSGERQKKSCHTHEWSHVTNVEKKVTNRRVGCN